MKPRLILFVSCLALSSLACADESVHPCAQVASKEKRLSCYDSAFPLSQAVIAKQVQQAEASFGLLEEKPVDEVREVEAKVLEVDYVGNKRTISLDNGQNWLVTDGGAQVVKGEIVTVRKGIIGSYLLRTAKGVDLRVRRSH